MAAGETEEVADTAKEDTGLALILVVVLGANQSTLLLFEYVDLARFFMLPHCVFSL